MMATFQSVESRRANDLDRGRKRDDEILGAFVELERAVLTVTFYLESIQ